MNLRILNTIMYANFINNCRIFVTQGGEKVQLSKFVEGAGDEEHIDKIVTYIEENATELRKSFPSPYAAPDKIIAVFIQKQISTMKTAMECVYKGKFKFIPCAFYRILLKHAAMGNRPLSARALEFIGHDYDIGNDINWPNILSLNPEYIKNDYQPVGFWPTPEDRMLAMKLGEQLTHYMRLLNDEPQFLVRYLNIMARNNNP